jgi:uncharacterized surface protein with fasciclin (FAS1) repeats
MPHRRRLLIAASALGLAGPALAQAPFTTRTLRETNVIDTLAGIGGYGEFIRLAQLSGAVETMRGPGPFIVLAPSDAALGRLPGSIIANLAPQQAGANPGSADPVRLSAFVNSHIIEGRGAAAALRSGPVVMRTRNGNGIEFQPAADGTIRATSTGEGGYGAGGINLDPRERVILSEIIASNGVIWAVSLPFLL